ncbi:hypothetical protein ACF1AY_04740 [Streptomyces sp. NPDC014776]|uniref:hypothetical protein n=1 Tax=Streptomyces sp. NPDC014776 TaxID=3364909 RepID=UPI0036FAFC82
MPIKRSVLANLESGRRTTVSVSEVLVLAAALEIPPVLLLFPVGYSETHEALPGKSMQPMDAVDWFGGRLETPWSGRVTQNAMWHYRKHRTTTRRLRDKLLQREEARKELAVMEYEQEMVARRMDEATAALEAARAEYMEYLTVTGLTPDSGELPPEVAAARERMEIFTQEAMDARRMLATIKYSKSHLRSLDEQIETLSSELEKLRIDIRDRGWILPQLSDDVYGVLEARRLARADEAEPELP